ncbi:nuclear transport factor 2 NTF2 domain containing protein [Nitzschia inconspicua]|uniref:Nuclear transport factor 2 n=1 Tax=Nitzschia inconspicua TaxID=303405 RepID=A0A9K3PLS3_9STRA|nr:nuclear transport factor 2 NTF2 domain containing protein [Nitzschia inconspicua]
MSAEEIAKSFCNHYYQTFDSSPANLRPLFTPQSMMTFEGNQIGGVDAIIQKITDFGKLTHIIKTIDVQPSPNPQAMFIFVTGACKIGDDQNALHFCEFIQLVAGENNSFYVSNSIFRLNYGL